GPRSLAPAWLAQPPRQASRRGPSSPDRVAGGIPMLTQADNELLTRTSAGTAMGEYFRRFWQPIALSRELAEPDGAPIRVRVMGEDLVAFRDTKGRVGLVE